MTGDVESYLKNTWLELEREIKTKSTISNRFYRRLDKIKDIGIRLGIVMPGNIREMLIELSDDEMQSISNPNWTGMSFEIINIEVNKKKIKSLRLYMTRNEHENIFILVCADIIESLDSVKIPENRILEISRCLDKWSSFFKNYGFDGLSAEARRGLFGELCWMKKVMNAGMSKNSALNAWQGYKKSIHDFLYSNTAVEVKTTISKEPRTIRINGEKQLDDSGFDKLALYVLSIKIFPSGTLTLPSIVKELRNILSDDNYLKNMFELQLLESGYIKVHEDYYCESYSIEKEELFHVKNGFPRIIWMPNGTSLLSYSVTVSACINYLIDMGKFMDTIVAGEQNA